MSAFAANTCNLFRKHLLNPNLAQNTPRQDAKHVKGGISRYFSTLVVLGRTADIHQCDEARPRCQNCEKGGRECVYVPKSPRPMAQPIPSEPSTSSLPYFDPNFSFRGPTAQTTALPLQPPTSTSRYPYDDIYSATQSLDPSDQYASRRNSTSASNSMAPSPQTRQPAPSTSTPMVRNAVLVNNIQSQMALRRAIHGFSRDFRLRGQPFTVETILSPLIYRSSALKHAIFANFILQAEQAKQHPPTSPLGTAAQDLSSAHVRHYHSAITHLRPNLGVPAMSDSNIATSLILAFYSICAGDMNNWAAHIRSTSDQIRLRGSNIDTHPLGLHTKFLFSMYMRTDTVGSNAVGQPANTDREIARIVYSGVPISGKILLPYRIELELLLAESSRFQYECNAYLSSVGAPWNDAHQETILREKYEDLLDRLGRWDGMNSELVSVEEAQPGEYIQGAMLPTEMGLPLLCVISRDLPFVDLLERPRSCSNVVSTLYRNHKLAPGCSSTPSNHSTSRSGA